MKSLLILLLICISFCCKSNSIDKLQTLDDVKLFLKHVSKQNGEIEFFCRVKKNTTQKLSQKKFIKIDLNNDGLTDLIVNGTYLFVVVDDGKNHFNCYYIDDGPGAIRKYILVHIDKTRVQPKIIVKANNRYEYRSPGNAAYDTLIVKYNGLVNYTNHPETNKIKEIVASTSGCYGTCPIFELKLSSDGTAAFNAMDYNDKEGLFKGVVDKETLNSLFNLTNYIRVRSVKDKYAVTWTDDQTITIAVTFMDGSIKNIKDYGLIGTFGLANLYGKLFEIKNHTKWESAQN